MSKQADIRNRIIGQIDAVRRALADLEIAVKWDRTYGGRSAFEDIAYADFLDAAYDLTEIDVLYELSREVRRQADRSEEIEECRRNGAHLRADILEARA